MEKDGKVITETIGIWKGNKFNYNFKTGNKELIIKELAIRLNALPEDIEEAIVGFEFMKEKKPSLVDPVPVQDDEDDEQGEANDDNSDEENDDSDDGIDSCIEELTEYYNNQEGIISVETGKIAVGFSGNNKIDIIDVAEEYGLTVYSEHESFIYLTVPTGEEILWICTLSKDDRIEDKIEWIEPNVIFEGSGNSG